MRNVAILRDGYSDFLVVRKFIKCLLAKHRNENLGDSNFIDLEQLNITNPLVKYLDKVKRSGIYSYHSDEATELVNELISVYYGCYSRFIKEYDVITNKEIIIINADTESLLIDRSKYFENWAYSIKGLIHFSIERFYEEMSKQGYSYEFMPYIVPLVLFPSSEILVASCIYNITQDKLRELKPNPALKTKVYGTNSIPEAIESGNLESILEKYLISNNINEIYKEIPEARILIQSLIA